MTNWTDWPRQVYRGRGVPPVLARLPLGPGGNPVRPRRSHRRWRPDRRVLAPAGQRKGKRCPGRVLALCADRDNKGWKNRAVRFYSDREEALAVAGLTRRATPRGPCRVTWGTVGDHVAHFWLSRDPAARLRMCGVASEESRRSPRLVGSFRKLQVLLRHRASKVSL
jgi:hypothetical protein